MPPTPGRLLPLLGTPGRIRPSGRSAVTCLYRCGNACASEHANDSDNSTFADVLAASMARRSVLKTGAAAALVVAASGLDLDQAAATEGAPAPLTFAPVKPNTVDNVVVPAGYASAVVVRWGDPVEPGAPAFNAHRQSAAAQDQQFGYNCDYVAALPAGTVDGHSRALLVVNHEYTDEQLMFPGWTGFANATPEQIRITMAAHGMSVVEIERNLFSGRYLRVEPAQTTHNRRLTTSTPYRLTGPAAGSPLLRTSADPTGRTVRGSLNNCAGGTTPWGTVLSGEENIDQYFVNGKDAPAAEQEALDRYGFDITEPWDPESSRGWHRVDPRFDIAREPHEPNRFGWVIEIDPYTRSSRPAKRTALGRLKHEGAEVRLTQDGRPVVYMGDDERFEYIYKFVSSRKMMTASGPTARAHNDTLLDFGTLFVARFTGDTESEVFGYGRLPSDGEFDGTGQWVPLVSGTTSHVSGMSAAEVLVHTRLAADAVGATKMDRPEDIQCSPVTGRVYAALTNNSERTLGHISKPNPTGVDEANPRARSQVNGEQGLTWDEGNRNGHILEWEERNNDPAATSFRWRVFLLAGDPADPTTYFAGYDKSQVSPISCPDNLTFDASGNLWIATDGNRLGFHDGFFAVPTAGPERGKVRMFLTVPNGAEACGPYITGDGQSMFCAVQHPGEVDGSTFESPASSWPDGRLPKPSVVVVWRQAQGSKRIGA
ncbi:MAG: PhoX family phosphatase [Actinomycetota bacterium]|nr:PhoX family phosphatase [Actinomycetota bacterium]